MNGPASSVVSEDILGEMTGSRDSDGDKKDEIDLIERELREACNNPEQKNSRADGKAKPTKDLRLKKVKS